MVTKRVSFRGASIADRLGQLSNFICNDHDNLKWNPPGIIDTETGIAENRFRVTEYIAPIWSKINVTYEKTATYGEYDGKFSFYGLDNLGVETLIYERSMIETGTGTSENLTLDLLKNACASTFVEDSVQTDLIGNITTSMPLLRSTYDDVEMTTAWYDSSWTKRKGIPVHETLQMIKGYGSTEAINSVNQDFWYFVVDVTYDADMQADFDDIRFCGFDGITILSHWLISKTDSTTAKFLVLLPWYFGYYEVDKRTIFTNVGYYYGVAEAQQDVYSNSNIKYVWMYYGNSSATSTSDEDLDGHTWFTDTFTDETLSWSTSGTDANKTIVESGGYLTGTMNAGQTGNIYAYEEIDTDATGESFDVIFKINDYYKTNSGTYAHRFGVGTDTNNYIACSVDHSDVYLTQFVGGAGTSFTAGNEDYAHDDTAPLYIRLRVNSSSSATLGKGVTLEISKDCRKWDTVKHVLDTTDISFDVSTITRVIYNENVSGAAAGNSYANIDWVQVIPCNNNAEVSYQFNDNSEFTEFPARWAGANFSAGTKEWARDAPNSEIDFGIAASAVWESGTDTAPRLYITGALPVGYGTATVIETKLTKHARTTNGAVRAGISFGTNANNHIDVYHQLHQDAQYNENMKMVRTLAGVNVTIQEQQYGAVPMADGPIWMRIIVDTINRLVVGEYSTDGYNWITLGANNLSEYTASNIISLYLKNDGGGNGTASFDYFKVYRTAEPYNIGESFTAEQAYTDYDDINALSEVNYIYIDDFEDNKYTGRTWPYRDYTAKGGTLEIESAAPITGSYSLKHTGSGADSTINEVIFKDNNIAYTATFNFKLTTQGTVGGTPYIRLWEPRASGETTNYGTLVCIDTIWNGANQILRLVEYDRRSGTQVTTANWILGSKLGTATTYAFEIIDTGRYITVKVDGVTYLNAVDYGTRATVKKIIPGKYKGFGANGDSAGRWDDIVITPTNTQTIDYGNEYTFQMPTTWLRNQPMMMRWKLQGSDTWNYSKQKYLMDQRYYHVGASELDKYIGMTTRITFTGDTDDSLEITRIEYEYEV